MHNKQSQLATQHLLRDKLQGNEYMQELNTSRLNQNQGSLARFGAKLWNSICDELRQLPKRAFKKHINDMLFSLLQDDYDESPILLQKIANYRTDTQFNLLSTLKILFSLVSQLNLLVTSG